METNDLDAVRQCFRAQIRLATAWPGGKSSFGIAMHPMPAALAERMPLSGVLDRDAGGRGRREAGRLEVDVRRGLPSRDLLEETVAAKRR